MFKCYQITLSNSYVYIRSIQVFANYFYINNRLLCLLGCLTYNIESEHLQYLKNIEKKKKNLNVLYLQNKNLLMGISNAPKVYYASSFKNVLYWDCAILNFPSKFHDLP